MGITHQFLGPFIWRFDIPKPKKRSGDVFFGRTKNMFLRSALNSFSFNVEAFKGLLKTLNPFKSHLLKKPFDVFFFAMHDSH